MKLQPLEDRIVVRPAEAEETTVSGLVIPDTAKEKPQQGEVLAVGPGRRAENSGEIIPLDLAVGDSVVYSKYGGTEITVDGEDLLILSGRDVLAKVSEKTKARSKSDISDNQFGFEGGLRAALVVGRWRTARSGSPQGAGCAGRRLAWPTCSRPCRSGRATTRDEHEVARTLEAASASSDVAEIVGGHLRVRRERRPPR